MRQFLAVCAALTVLTTSVFAKETEAKKKDEKVNVHSFKMNTLAGKEVDLKKYDGKVILAVNVASRCGYTRHYEGLQELYEKYKEKGLVVLGFPCNQFGKQEAWNFEGDRRVLRVEIWRYLRYV